MKRIDLTKVKPAQIRRRYSKVTRRQLAPNVESRGVAGFIDSLPEVLRAADLKILSAKIIAAHKRRKPIVWMFGAHVLKVGLAPMLAEIIETGFAQQISTNNASLIHDLELAFFGKTSEDVETSLAKGEFGITANTVELYARVADLAAEENIGLGEAAGRFINAERARYRQSSVFAVAERKNIPATIHVAIGTDIVNSHPAFDGGKVGGASQIDFEVFCHTITGIKNGGVALNFGSAVVLPEVFLKALAIARNLDKKFGKFTAANFDMYRLYRPSNNIVNRPRLLGATTFEFSGHHEIMMPLLWCGIKDKMKL